MYAGFADFAFWRMTVASAHLNGGFARAADLKAADVLSDLTDVQALVEAEAGAVEHMNADHAEAIRLYATKLLDEADGPWRLTGLDPDGLDLSLGDRTARLAFEERVIEAGQLRKLLVALAQQARTVA
jgi:putative heme iron utilization protein